MVSIKSRCTAYTAIPRAAIPPQEANSRHYKIYTYTSVGQNVTFLITLVRKNAMLRYSIYEIS